MSVFTPVEHHQLVEFLRNYSVGTLLVHEGISDGIENTNYFVSTDQREMVLTLFETHTFAEMGYFLDLMAHLSEHAIPSAHPVPDNNGDYLRTLNDRPAALVERLNGTSLDHPTDQQCADLGTTLARMHVAGSSFKGRRKNSRGHEWRIATGKKLLSHIPERDTPQLLMELDYQQANRFDALPGGVIHADLFRDNALWNGDTLTGIIDFYYACDGVFLYDIAIAANDWCVEADGSFVGSRYRAMFEAYHAIRPLAAEEINAWPSVVRAAALRFWLSRLHDWHFPRPGEITHRKDPDAFGRLLRQRQAACDELPIHIS